MKARILSFFVVLCFLFAAATPASFSKGKNNPSKKASVSTVKTTNVSKMDSIKNSNSNKSTMHANSNKTTMHANNTKTSSTKNSTKTSSATHNKKHSTTSKSNAPKSDSTKTKKTY